MTWLLQYYLGGSGVSTAVPVTAKFLGALRDRLLAVEGLEGLSDIYLTEAPPNAAFPFLIINRLYQSPIINTSDAYYKEVGCQFMVYSLDDVEADAIGEAAYDDLFPTSGGDPIRFAEGYEMSRSPGQSNGPEAMTEGRPNGYPVWRFLFDYVFLLGKG